MSAVLDSRVVYISLSHSEMKIADRYVFDPDFKHFIRKHLSMFDDQRLASCGLKPTLMCNPDIYRGLELPAYCLRPVLQLEYRQHYQYRLYQAILDRMKKKIDAVVYTRDEFNRDKNLMFYKRVLAATSTLTSMLLLITTGPTGAVVLATIGLASSLEEIAVNL
ncbi:MAG: hypothetical protein ACSLEN_14540 [Candidatus Malihini olakiniferum]